MEQKVRTTSVRLRGDEFKAKQLADAHVNRLLKDFRKLAEFQQLRISSQQKNFFDDSGKFIGTISIQSIFGVETVIVTAGGEKAEKKRKIIREIPIARIVPIIASLDNKYWVACLSGTFDGPYQVFENKFNIPVESFNGYAEQSMDNKLIALGASPEKGVLAELVFLAQTGEMPDYDGEHPEEYAETSDQGGSSDYSFVGNEIFICEDGKSGAALSKYNGYSLSTNTVETQIFSEVFDLFSYSVETRLDRDRSFERLYSYSESGVTEEDISEELAALDPPYYDATEYEFFMSPYLPGSGSIELSISTIIGESKSLWSSNFSVRAERTNPSNKYAACYRTTTTNYKSTISKTYDVCTGEVELNDITTNVVSYCDYMSVDGESVALRDATNDSYPRFLQSELRYYNTESPAAVTGIASARTYSSATEYSWKYFYVGPASDGELNVTEFVKDLSYAHTISGVPGLPADTAFYGDIFLGMIKYNKKSEVQV